ILVGGGRSSPPTNRNACLLWQEAGAPRLESDGHSTVVVSNRERKLQFYHSPLVPREIKLANENVKLNILRLESSGLMLHISFSTRRTFVW
ncbi:hypothetical protein DPEC_G00062850, partial [Dallia pectoralis]